VKYTPDFVFPAKEKPGFKYFETSILHSDSSFIGMTKRVYFFLVHDKKGILMFFARFARKKGEEVVKFWALPKI
jgi:hypothetical protein